MASTGTTPHRSRPRRLRTAICALAVLVPVAVTSTIGVAGSATAGTGATAAAHRAQLKAVLTLSASRTGIGSPVTASLHGSKVPKGHTVKITLSWGDHSPSSTLRRLTARPSHRYASPGRYTARLTVRDTHKVAHASAAETVTAAAGSYSGSNGQTVSGLTFFISTDGTRLQDISIPGTALGCGGGSATGDHLAIAEAPIAADGSFTVTTTEQGVSGALAGQQATFTRTFRGHLTGVNAAGVPQAAGTWLDTLVASSGATCTSSDQSWTAVRDAQPPQTSAPPPAGTYTGSNGQTVSGLTFHVSSDSTQLQEITVPGTALACLGGGATGDHLAIPQTPVQPDGSFTATTTRQGLLIGQPVTFTAVFRGNFHAVDATGVPRATGTWRETATFTTGRYCTSNEQTWKVTRTGP